jgi:outer membrane protein
MFHLYGCRLLFLVALCLILAGAASAQTNVGVINTQKALLDSAEMKKAQADLEAKFRPRQEEMAKLQKELEEIRKQLDTLAGKLTQEAQADLTIQGQRKQREFQRLGEDLRADVDRERSDILRKTGGQMREIVAKLAEEKGLDIVIDLSNTVYVKPALDLTKEATAAYDRAHPAP